MNSTLVSKENSSLSWNPDVHPVFLRISYTTQSRARLIHSTHPFLFVRFFLMASVHPSLSIQLIYSLQVFNQKCVCVCVCAFSKCFVRSINLPISP